MRPSVARVIGAVLAGCLIAAAVGPASGAAATGDPTPVDPGSAVAAADDAGTTDGTEANRTASNVLETTHAAVEYREGYAAEADRIASFVDDYYELLHQTFSVHPAERRVPIVVGPREAAPCDTAGCVDPLGRIHVSSASRSLVYHELVHTLQLRTHWSPVERLSEPAPVEGTVIEGTATYLDSSAARLAASARFDPDTIELASYPESTEEYAERALFVEYVLAEYGREAFDSLYLEGDVDALENATGTELAALRAAFEAGLDDQRARLASGGTPLPAFTYEPFVAAPGEEVRFDARTPAAVAALGRERYPDDPDGFAWDLTGDGEVDATGPTATGVFDGPGPHEVTLAVTVDGERHEATQTVLLSDPVVIVDANLPATLAPGESAVASATVTNGGDREATRTVTYAVGGRPAAERTVTLAPGETTTLELRVALPEVEAGTHDATLSVGTETVERSTSVERTASADPPDAIGTAAESIPGFAALGALCALLFATVVVARRSGA